MRIKKAIIKRIKPARFSRLIATHLRLTEEAIYYAVRKNRKNGILTTYVALIAIAELVKEKDISNLLEFVND